MATKTNIELRKKFIYQIFIRQYSEEGSFSGVTKDLERLEEMGVNIIYLMPFHQIGKKDRKGSIGSPYSITNYYSIDRSYGTLEDFRMLIKEAHKRGIKVMMDIVFNHTSRDSLLTEEKREWFYQRSDNSLGNKIGDWSDIADLNFTFKGVWEYLIDVLKYWAKYVDGFRCDVAFMIPLEFWELAKKEVSNINNDIIWLAETADFDFIKHLRDNGFICHSDSELYQVFDICYDYDTYYDFKKYLSSQKTIGEWLDKVFSQEQIYPVNYHKIRAFENHDQERLRSLTKSDYHFKQLLALQFFLRGIPFIYAGMEHMLKVKPNLFEKDILLWNKENSIESLIKTLAEISSDSILVDGIITKYSFLDAVVFSYHKKHNFLIGGFNTEDKEAIILPLKDGLYHNLVSQENLLVKNGIVEKKFCPVIIKTVFENIK